MKRCLEESAGVSQPLTVSNDIKKFKKNHGPKMSLVKNKTDADKTVKKFYKKPKWNEFKEERKLLRRKRKEKRINAYAISDDAKKIFEELRCHKCPSDKKMELANKLYKIFSGKLNNIVKSHDMARMVQWLIKVGSPETRLSVINEVLKDSVNLCTCQYSHHIIKKIIQLNSKHNNEFVLKSLLNKVFGNIVKLLGNKFSCPILDELYTRHASNKEKSFIKQELYSDLFKGMKNPNLSNLGQAIEENKLLRNVILKSAKTILLRLINKSSALSTNILTDVLWDYLQHCEEKDKNEVLELLKYNVRPILKTRSGAEVAVSLLWIAMPKVKKAMIKSLKNYIIVLAKTEAGSIFLRALFDSVDDTVLLRKAVLLPLIENSEELVRNDYGRKVILYLVAHRDTAYFHPVELDKYKKADELAHVKKDINIRLNEMLMPYMDPLLKKISESPTQWISDGRIGLVTFAILKKAKGEMARESFLSISRYIAENTLDERIENKLIEDSGVHMVLKKLIKSDVELEREITFSSTFVEILNEQLIKKLLMFNRGCFLIVLLIETNIHSVLNILKEKFNTVKILEETSCANSQGALILTRLIKEKELM